MEQVKRPQVKKTLGVLQVAKSRVLRGWRKLVSRGFRQNRVYNGTLDELLSQCLYYEPMLFLSTTHFKQCVSPAGRFHQTKDGDITVVANEAKDNVKFLYTLDKFFEPLGKCTPVNVHCVFVSS